MMALPLSERQLFGFKTLANAQLSTTYMYTHIIDDQQNTALVQMGQQIMGGDENGER